MCPGSFYTVCSRHGRRSSTGVKNPCLTLTSYWKPVTVTREIVSEILTVTSSKPIDFKHEVSTKRINVYLWGWGGFLGGWSIYAFSYDTYTINLVLTVALCVARDYESSTFNSKTKHGWKFTQDTLRDVILAFSRDPWIRRHSDVVLHDLVPIGEGGGEASALLGRGVGDFCPPCGVQVCSHICELWVHSGSWSLGVLCINYDICINSRAVGKVFFGL